MKKQGQKYSRAMQQLQCVALGFNFRNRLPYVSHRSRKLLRELSAKAKEVRTSIHEDFKALN